MVVIYDKERVFAPKNARVSVEDSRCADKVVGIIII